MKLNILFILLFLQLAAKAQFTADSIGAQTYRLVVKTYGLYQNEALLNEVKSIGRDLEKNLPFQKPLNYYLVDTYEPNAFATMGGYVYVTRGLLAIINTRDELAGVMAHEISHVTLHHARKSIEAKIIPVLLEIPGNIIGSLTNPSIGEVINAPIELPASLTAAAFSRSQEKNADLTGVDLAIQSGFEPYGLVTALERLTAYIETVYHIHFHKNVMLDHPLTPTRSRYLIRHLEKKGFTRTPQKAGTRFSAAEGLIYGQDPTYGILNTNQFAHPAFQIQMTLPDQWQHQINLNTLTSVSKDKQNIFVAHFDTAAQVSALDMANKAWQKIRSSTQNPTFDTLNINGFKCYRIMTNSTSETRTLYFFLLPDQKKNLSLLTVSTDKTQGELVSKSVFGLAAITPQVLDSMHFQVIKIRKPIATLTVKDYCENHACDDAFLKELGVLNGLSPEMSLDGTEEGIKAIHLVPLQNWTK
jgi:predicted Zn-dependent protease